MVRSTVDIFETTLQKTNVWLKEINERLDWDDRHKAYIALRAVLHAIRDRLTVEAVAKFGAQLPLLIRGFYYEGWVPSENPLKIHTRDDFVDLVRTHLANTNLEESAEDISVHVIRVIKKHVSEGEIETIKAILPRSVASIWEE